jgi:hypothetical protein
MSARRRRLPLNAFLMEAGHHEAAQAPATYNEPYNLARRLASVDHVSGGRAGWNIVTSAGADEAADFGLDDRPGHADSSTLEFARAGDLHRPRRRVPAGRQGAVGQLGGRGGHRGQDHGTLRRPRA